MSRIVQVKVQEIRPGGLIVKLLFDGRHGYIRRRELSWDRRVRVQPPMPAVGALIEAKLIDDPSVLHYIPLSVRQLTDPWQPGVLRLIQNAAQAGLRLGADGLKHAAHQRGGADDTRLDRQISASAARHHPHHDPRSHPVVFPDRRVLRLSESLF